MPSMDDYREPDGLTPEIPVPASSPGKAYCRVCDASFEPGTKFCANCGGQLTSAEQDSGPVETASPSAAPEPVAPAPPPPQPAEWEPPPSHAQNALGPDPVAKLPPPVPVPACSHCGTGVSPGFSFCPGCGLALSTAGEGPTLTMVHPAGIDRKFAIDVCGALIGKGSDCKVLLDQDRYVSRRHARVICEGDVWYLEDLQSRNGSFLKVTKPIALSDGDEILIGETVLRFAEGRE